MITSSKLIIACLVASNLVFIGLYSFDNLAALEPRIVENKPIILKTTVPADDAQLRALQQKVVNLEQALLKERRQHQAAIAQWQQAHANAVQVKASFVNDTHAFIDSYLDNQQLDKNGKPLLIGKALQKWQENTEAALVERIASETSPEKLLQLTRQLQSLKTKESLNDETSQKLLKNTAYLNPEQQSEMLASLEDKVSGNVLKDLEPLLYSNNEDVAEEAFLRLQDMGINSSTRPYFDQLAVNSQSQWVRNQAKQMTSKTNSDKKRTSLKI